MEIKKNITVKEIEKLKPGGYYYSEDKLVKVFKENDGYGEKRTYNKNGDELTFEDSGGAGYKNTYDENGNKITYENSYGYKEKYTYDKNGNKTTHKEGPVDGRRDIRSILVEGNKNGN